jgi:ribosome biogenesis GTPase A
MLLEIIHNKPRLILLNKVDLADPKVTKEWLDYYQAEDLKAVETNSLTDNLQVKIYEITKEILKTELEKEKVKGKSLRPLNAIVIGIPNVGKSQFINNLAKKNKVRTGNKPGVTKIQSFLNAGDNLRVYDNPGVLWPKFDDETGLKLALLGSIKDSLLPLDDVVLYGIDYLKKYYPDALNKRYKINTQELDAPLAILDQIGKNRGCLISGGEIDYDRVFNLFLNDLRNGELGRMSFERVSDDVSI